jgi:hypothetical protein
LANGNYQPPPDREQPTAAAVEAPPRPPLPQVVAAPKAAASPTDRPVKSPSTPAWRRPVAAARRPAVVPAARPRPTAVWKPPVRFPVGVPPPATKPSRLAEIVVVLAILAGGVGLARIAVRERGRDIDARRPATATGLARTNLRAPAQPRPVPQPSHTPVR